MRAPTIRLRLDGDTALDYHPSDAPIVIGRAVDVEVQVANPMVSRRHAVLTFEQGWVLTDSGSNNGTWVDGHRIDRHHVGQALDVRLGDRDSGPVLRLAVHAATEPIAPRGQETVADLSIGRDPASALHVPDLLASWHHAQMQWRAGRWWLSDLGSRNQTLVNGVAVERHPLVDRDRVLIGNTRLVFRAGRLVEDHEESGFVVDNACLTLRGGRRIVDEVSFSIEKASLVAIIGPSGAGKSSLLRLVTGQLPPSSGTVAFHGATMESQRRAHRGQIGVVPQYTVAHPTLTARVALDYTAQLRLADDVRPAERRALVAAVLERLGLTVHADTQMSRLSGGQQRRVGIAMEMVTDPAMLILDEPTAGLDPSLVLQIMQVLHGLADADKHVLVVTHDLEHLALVDRVLVLRAGGTVAFHGPPGDVFDHFGTSSWAETFTLLAAPTSEADARDSPVARQPRMSPVDLAPPPVRAAAVWRHASVVVRRQLRLTVADPFYLGLLIGMPLVLGVLALAVPGSDGLGSTSDPTSTEAARLLVLLIVGAAFLGLSAPVRDLVGERSIYLHEREAGLSVAGYLAAKLVVFTVLATLQSSVLVGLLLVFRPGPAHALVLGSADLELVAAVVATALCGVAAGLAISSRVATTEQSMPPLVLLVMGQLVMCGGLFPVDGRGALPVLSSLFPTRWGYAAAAATTGLNGMSPAVDPDGIWAHAARNWVGCMLLLAVLAVAFTAVAARGVSRRPRFG